MERTLKEELLVRMDRPADVRILATSIMDLAAKGDKTALNVINKLLDEKRFSDEEKNFPLTDEQFKAIILIAADRIRSNHG